MATPRRPPVPWMPSMLVLVLVAMLISFGSQTSALVAQEPQPQEPQSQEPWVEMEVATVGVDLQSGAPLALLRSGWAEVLPIWIGELEAGAIARALAEVPTPRPMTHDLLLGIMGTLGGTLEEVRVTEVREETFIGVLRIRTAGGIREVDTRPSDALALAARTGARVVVARPLLANLPDLDFLSLEGGANVGRFRGVTVGDAATGSTGVEVLHVAAGTATRALETGDRIVSVEGRPVRSPGAFVNALLGRNPAAAVEVERERGGTVTTVRIPPRRPPGQVGP